MKTIIKLSVSVIVSVIIMLTPSSCKKEDTSGGYMTIKMTDAPADYLAVNVDVRSINMNVENGGWINLPIHAGIYNLLELQNNVSVVLADDVKLPIGKIHQLRLILGTNNTIKTIEGVYPLSISSGSESGLKINMQETITKKEHLEVVLDFDVKASIVENGNHSFSLKPVIKVKSVTQI